MKNILFTLLLILTISSSSMAQSTKSVTDLPDISVVGKFLGTNVSDTNSFDVEEVEFFFQHNIAPSVRATAVSALSKDETTGIHSMELEEAYVAFSDITTTLFPSASYGKGIGVTVGKKLLPIGPLNALHSEQLSFVDMPMVNQQFFGTDHNLSGEGALFSYLLPLPFFSQVELGYWTASSEEEEDEESHSEIEYSNRIFNGRLWNGFDISDSQNVELGFSYVLGNASSSSTEDQQLITGIDAMFTQELSTDQSLRFHAEYYEAKYGEDDEARETQTGSFVSAFYEINSMYDAGIRYGILNAHGDEGDDQTKWSLIANRQLTEASKLRVQYSTGDNVEDTVYLQFIFGMGPHSHVLQ